MPTHLRRAPRKLSLSVAALFCMLLLLRRPDVAASAADRALSLCVHTVIPAIFPFAVLSRFLLSSRTVLFVLSLAARPVGALLRVGRSASLSVLLGLCLGSPMGAIMLADGLDRGTVTREECERALFVATLPSPAFLLGVGRTLLGSRSAGVLLLCSTVLASLLSGMLLRGRLSPQGARTPLVPSRTSLSEALSQSASAMVGVCACILFFSMLSDALALVLTPLPSALRDSLLSLLEVSDGIRRVSAYKKIPAACLSALAAGWSGISIHTQIHSILHGRDLSFSLYCLGKALTGALAALVTSLALFLFPSVL